MRGAQDNPRVTLQPNGLLFKMEPQENSKIKGWHQGLVWLRTHTHTHTHTHTDTHTQTPPHSHTLSHTHKLSHAHTLTDTACLDQPGREGGNKGSYSWSS